MSIYHTPVMLTETLEFLVVKKDCWYLDCTLGGGGHTQGILRRGGKVLGIDLDPEAIREVAENYHLPLQKINNHLQAVSEKLILYQTNFSELKTVVNQFNIQKICGVLFDLGVSSHQLETDERGFSFNLEAPLDMRMNPEANTVTAADLVNALHESELVQLFQRFGDERFAKPIAKRIIQTRQRKKITTTNELAQIILSARPRSPRDRTHPATRVFQALRIAVNDELYSLELALPQALEVLSPGGRLAVISFHSLEDRVVKNLFKNEYKKRTITILTQKPIIPSKKEVKMNPRSRSGKLRAAEKI